MGVVNFINYAISDGKGNVTPNSIISGIITTIIVGYLIFAFFYLPYKLVFDINTVPGAFGALTCVIGLLVWALLIIYCMENGGHILGKRGDKVLYKLK